MAGMFFRPSALAFLFILFSGACFAWDCASDAYSNSCRACTFDGAGKMLGSCSEYWTGYGKRCISEKRPMLAWMYSNGGCSEVDACAAELTACKEAVSVGSDQLDCVNPAVMQCFQQSDACVARADRTCNDDLGNLVDVISDLCPIPILMLLGLPAFAFVFARKR